LGFQLAAPEDGRTPARLVAALARWAIDEKKTGFHTERAIVFIVMPIRTIRLGFVATVVIHGAQEFADM
jgi:hypothetical protein